MNVTQLQSNQRFFFSGFRLSSREAQAMLRNIPSPILAVGAEPSNLIHLFDSEEAFESWAIRTEFAPQFKDVNSIIRSKKGGLDGVRILASSNLRSEIGSYEPQAALFENAGMSGHVHALGAGTYNDLSKLGLTRRIGSASVSGMCMISERANFAGSKLYLLGDPSLEVGDLAELGLSQYAGSAIVI